ncbi:MAG: hypothetical protein ACM31C_11025 [Acidobacteriota bacterium]
MVKLALVALLAGCSYVTDSFTTNDFSGDPFPFPIENAGGAIVIGVQPDGDTVHTGVLDVMSPVTIVDHGPQAAPTIDFPNVTLFGVRAATGELDLPRAKLIEPQLVTLHPCSGPECDVGTDASPTAITSIVGMNAFASDALRLDLANGQIFILPDIAGDETARSYACDAVFPLPFRGGGTLLVGGTEVPFANWRIAIGACFAPDPNPSALQSARGADMLLVASTSIGTSLLAATSYQRYHDEQCPNTSVPCAIPDVATLPVASAFLPSGLVTGHLATIPSLALVGNSTSRPRAPCRQVYANHYLAVQNCDNPADPSTCPCYNASDSPHTSAFCAAPATVELAPAAGLPMLVIDDADPTLQALRAELRPNQPEVDGVLGTSALQGLQLDLDYPHARLLGRCSDASVCSARPELTGDAAERTQVQGCLGLQ